MLRDAAEPLKEWVREGGILYATGGCGLLDEYHRPLETLHELYGIEGHDLVRKTRHIRPRRTLPRTEPLDTLNLGTEEGDLALPALLYRETFDKAEGADALGTYEKDGAVGAVVNEYGGGRAYAIGALAGIAYVTPAMPPSSQVLPMGFPADIRRAIARPVREAEIVPPVRTSDPLVEAQYMTGEGGDIVVLTNWRQEPVEDLVVSFPGVDEVKSVRSLRAAGYFQGSLAEQGNGQLKLNAEAAPPLVTLPIRTIDFLLVD
jgi:hypothetical protein